MAFLRFLGSRWFLSFIGVALLAALLWVFGPFLDALSGVVIRAVLIAVLFLIWFGINFWISWHRRRADAVLAKGAAESARDATQAASAEEAAAMGDKLTQALSLLRRARGTRGYLYEQPWYVIIGPPGAGKTTALLNAGLKFPLAAEMGQGAVAGVGGTRMCDWWFTEDAVLIDTAGRYTTQDSDAAVDKAGWLAFLDLLKRTRARQPLNGVIVAISVADMAAAPPAERLAHARAIRTRVKELTDRLAVKVPVYALFTKADLLAGFTEFFDDLDRERRNQVWGTTFTLPARARDVPEGGVLGAFPAEFQALVQRLNDRLLDRLQAERSPERRAMIAGFPAQFATLEQPLSGFLQEAFGGSRLDPAPFLRGIYFASGTQEGTPIDRLTGALSRAFGVDQRRAPSLRPEQGRSYFLGRLLKDVIFGEAMLVSSKPGATRRRMLIRAGAFSLIALLTLGAGGWLFSRDVSAKSDMEQTAAALAAYEQTAKPLPLDPVNDDDLPKIMALLEQARHLPHGYDSGPAPSSLGAVGLSQDAKLAFAAREVYKNALGRALLPRLIWRLESQIRGSLDRPDFTYEATRVYLMLGNAGPLDKNLVREWMQLDWEQRYPGPGSQPFRDALMRHLTAMLDNPLPKVTLDGALVADARRTFSRVTLAERVYSRLKPMAAAQHVAPWAPADAIGATGATVFVRASGKKLTDGIPGFYTVEGFHKVVLPLLPEATKEVASESWVLGTRQEVDPNSPQMQNLEHDVVGLYVNDYAKQWDAMLADLNVVPLRNMGQAVQDLYVLSSPQSPMKELLVSIARQLTLSVPPAEPKGAADQAGGVAGKAVAAGIVRPPSSLKRLQGLLATPGGPPPEPPGKVIDDRYKALRDFVGKGPGAPIDIVLKLLNDMQGQLNRLASAPAGSAAAPTVATGEDPAAQLRAEASRDPEPVARWLLALAGGGTTLRGGGAKQAVAAAFAGAGGPGTLCSKAVNGRYPFFAGASNEIPLDDFGRLFAPGGLLDGFFNTQIRPFVDMSGSVWHAQKVDGVAPPISPGDLAEFQRAAVIRDLFFAAGGNQPSVRFDIIPQALDSGAQQVTLDFDGVVVSYAHGPSRATQITWPGPNRMNNVRLVFDPPSPGDTGVKQASGSWALFRLFAQGTLTQAGGADKYTLSFRAGQRSATFEIRAGSVLNPFKPGVLQDFRCPSIK
jgi:type VI secretion system protein ImpL